MGMKTFSTSLAVIAASTGLAVAQPPPPPSPDPVTGPAGPQNTVGADVLAVLPTGDYADVADFGIGVAGRFSHALNPQIALTGRLGFLFHVGTPEILDESTSLTMLLIYAGVRYNFQQLATGDGLFGFGELGINHTTASFGDTSESDDNLSLNIGAGYQSGQLEFRGSLFYTSEDDSILGLMVGAGYNFTAF